MLDISNLTEDEIILLLDLREEIITGVRDQPDNPHRETINSLIEKEFIKYINPDEKNYYRFTNDGEIVFNGFIEPIIQELREHKDKHHVLNEIGDKYKLPTRVMYLLRNI